MFVSWFRVIAAREDSHPGGVGRVRICDNVTVRTLKFRGPTRSFNGVMSPRPLVHK